MRRMEKVDLFKGIPPNLLILLVVMQSLIFIVSVLVALDARERGMKKEASVFWSFIVMVFPPFIFLYMMFRTLRQRQEFTVGKQSEKPVIQAPPPPVPAAVKCPYCGGDTEPGAKLCKRCGRLL